MHHTQAHKCTEILRVCTEISVHLCVCVWCIRVTSPVSKIPYIQQIYGIFIFRRNSNLLSILQTQERKFEGVNLLHMSKQIYTFTLRFSIICKFEIYATSFEIYSFLKCLVAKQSKFEFSKLREVILKIQIYLFQIYA